MVRKASQYNYAVDTTYDEINMHEEESHAVFLEMSLGRLCKTHINF